MLDKRSPWYDPQTEKSRLLAALDETRRLCNHAAEVMPFACVPGSLILIEAIESAIDDYAEHEMGQREYFWGRPSSAGCKHEKCIDGPGRCGMALLSRARQISTPH